MVNGIQLVGYVANGRTDLAQATLRDMEDSLNGGDPAARARCLEVLDDVEAELDAWPKHHPMAHQVLRRTLHDLMGPSTRLAWAEINA